MRYTFFSLVFAVSALTSMTSFALPAEDPCALVDCKPGLVCEVQTEGSCNTSCVNDLNDPEEAPPCENACSSRPIAVCVPPQPADCDSDTDCGSDEACVTYTYSSCHSEKISAPIACAPDDEDCGSEDPVPEPECEEESESICVPKYAAPCEEALDCGPGFACEIPEVCSCIVESSDAPSKCASEEGTRCGDPAPKPCSCEESKADAYCKLIPVECDEENACDEGFTCVSEKQVRSVNDGQAKVACMKGTRCGVAPLPAKSFCRPEGYDTWVENGGSGSVDGKKVKSTERKGFFSGAGRSASKTRAEGCQVAHSPAGFGGSALLLLGFMFGFRRRN